MSIERRLFTKQLTHFEKSLQEILKKPWRFWQENPTQLAQISQLASPYFVSNFLPSKSAVDSPRSECALALLHAFRCTAESLWGSAQPQTPDKMESLLEQLRNQKETDLYHALHLELRFFQNYLRPVSKSAIFEDYLFISKKEENILFNGTIRRFGRALLTNLAQTSNSLPSAGKELICVESHIGHLQAWLQTPQTVTLTGQGGVGKTSLAAHWADQCADTPFWYTIRPYLNDQLSTFLFDLGQFLHQHDMSRLWKLILAEGGVVKNRHIALSVLLEDLENCGDKTITLIVDEVDHLLCTDPDLAQPSQIEFLEFLKALHGHVALLLVGQQPTAESDHYLELTGLLPYQMTELFQSRSITASVRDIEILYNATNGNPRLLLLCIALYESEQAQGTGLGFRQIVVEFERAPGFLPLLNRLWDRLETQERELLARLSVYQQYAPFSYWPATENERLQPTADSLIARRLIEQNERGAVTLLSALRQRIYTDKLTPMQRANYHLDAAVVLSLHAEYTSAAYHLNAGDEREQAIRLWYPVMDDEIKRGQAGTAFAIFAQMNQRRLPDKERKALVEIQARLHQLYGDSQSGLDVIAQEDWSTASEQTARILALKGNFEESLGSPHIAEKSYNQSLDITARLMAQRTNIYSLRGVMHMRQRDVNKAEENMWFAQYELLILQGILAQEKGDLTEAYAIYEQALKAAQRLGDPRLLARTYQELCNVQTKRGSYDEAIGFATEAKGCYEEIGDRLEAAKMDIVISSHYVNTGNYERVVPLCERTAKFFDAIQHPYLASVALVNLSEAFCNLGRIDQAEQTANKVLTYEEPHATPYAYFTLGLVCEARSCMQDAAQNYQRSLAVSELCGDFFIEAHARRSLGESLCQCNQLETGLAQLQQALCQFETMDNQMEITTTAMLIEQYTAKI